MDKMDYSLFLDEASPDPITIYPTRSLSNSSSVSDDSSTSSLAGINPMLREEQHRKMMISITQEKSLTNNLRSTNNNNGINNKTQPIHPMHNASLNSRNPVDLSKSPNFNSFYFLNDDEDNNGLIDSKTKNNPDSKSSKFNASEILENNANSRESGLELESVKHKLSSLWNNVKYSKKKKVLF